MGQLRFGEDGDEPKVTEEQSLQDQGQASCLLAACPPAPCHTPALGSDLLPAGSLTTYGLPRGVPLYLTPTL